MGSGGNSLTLSTYGNQELLAGHNEILSMFTWEVTTAKATLAAPRYTSPAPAFPPVMGIRTGLLLDGSLLASTCIMDIYFLKVLHTKRSQRHN